MSSLEKLEAKHEKWLIGTDDDAEMAQEYCMENLPALIAEYRQLIERVEVLENAARLITTLGGNLSDEALETPTGPNDAASRGIMYVSARTLARKALGADS